MALCMNTVELQKRPCGKKGKWKKQDRDKTREQPRSVHKHPLFGLLAVSVSDFFTEAEQNFQGWPQEGRIRHPPIQNHIMHQRHWCPVCKSLCHCNCHRHVVHRCLQHSFIYPPATSCEPRETCARICSASRRIPKVLIKALTNHVAFVFWEANDCGNISLVVSCGKVYIPSILVHPFHAPTIWASQTNLPSESYKVPKENVNKNKQKKKFTGATVGHEFAKRDGTSPKFRTFPYLILSSFPTSRTGIVFSSGTWCIHHNPSDIPAPMDVLTHKSMSHERGFCAWWQIGRIQITWSNSMTRNVGYC